MIVQRAFFNITQAWEWKADEDSHIIRVAKNKVLWNKVWRGNYDWSNKNSYYVEPQECHHKRWSGYGIESCKHYRRRLLGYCMMSSSTWRNVSPTWVSMLIRIYLDYKEELEKSWELLWPLTSEEVTKHLMMKAKETIKGHEYLFNEPPSLWQQHKSQPTITFKGKEK